jgi:hypothetical protein
LIKISEIENKLENVKSFKNIQSFNRTYVTDNNSVSLLSFELGEVVYKLIDELIDKLEENSFKVNPTNTKIINEISDCEDSITENSSDVRQYDDDYEIYKPEKEDDDEDHKMGSIPVLVYTCKKFNPPTVEYDEDEYDEFDNPDLEVKKKYIWNHILDCNDCKYINNNNYEVLQRVVRKKSLLTLECCLTDNEVLYECKEKYYSRKKYDPIGTLSKKESEIKLLYVNDKYDDYNKCVFLICVGIE